jgi:hypothetical protein
VFRGAENFYDLGFIVAPLPRQQAGANPLTWQGSMNEYLFPCQLSHATTIMAHAIDGQLNRFS